jgi:hypothetical protein
VFFKPLDTKQLGPDGGSVVPRRWWSTCPQPSPKPEAQRTLEARSAPAREVIDLDKHGLAAPSRWAWPPATPAQSHHPLRATSSRNGSFVRGFRKRLARDGTFDNYFRALAMAADGVSQTVRLADRQISRPELRHHAFIHPDGPAVLLFDNVKCDHRMSPRIGCREFRTLPHHYAADDRNASSFNIAEERRR